MKLGFLTAPFPDTPLMDVADWAASADFEVLEIACWPQATGPTRRYAGTSHIDVKNLSDAQSTEIVDEIAAKGLAISGLGYYPNPLHPDQAHRTEVIEHLKAVMVAARRMGIPLVNTFMGGDAAKINPLLPAELVIDHSVQVDKFGSDMAFAFNAEITLHVTMHYGHNLHHIAEAVFKSVGRSLAEATRLNPRIAGVLPSTKGTL